MLKDLSTCMFSSEAFDDERPRRVQRPRVLVFASGLTRAGGAKEAAAGTDGSVVVQGEPRIRDALHFGPHALIKAVLTRTLDNNKSTWLFSLWKAVAADRKARLFTGDEHEKTRFHASDGGPDEVTASQFACSESMRLCDLLAHYGPTDAMSGRSLSLSLSLCVSLSSLPPPAPSDKSDLLSPCSSPTSQTPQTRSSAAPCSPSGGCSSA